MNKIVKAWKMEVKGMTTDVVHGVYYNGRKIQVSLDKYYMMKQWSFEEDNLKAVRNGITAKLEVQYHYGPIIFYCFLDHEEDLRDFGFDTERDDIIST